MEKNQKCLKKCGIKNCSIQVLRDGEKILINEEAGIRMRYNKIEDLKVSKYIKISEKEDVVNIKVENPIANMQTDYADFEAISIIYKCINPKVKVTIEFKNLGNINGTKKWNGSFGNKDKDVNTYLRFLFRLYSFLKAFNWVSISNKSNEEELARFAKIYEEALKNKMITNNYPISKSSFDEKKGQEHAIEKIFSQTSKGSQYLRKLYKNIYPDDTLKCMYDQLPNGLFNTDVNGKPHEKNRIFTSGAYDIWGIDDKNDFCIFELKKNKGNAGLGVISELFFYAVFAKEILCNKNRINASTKKCRELRGYNKLYDFSQTNKVNEVRAIFLLGEGVHPAIKEMYEKGKLLEVLNTNKFGIKFNFLQYDYDKVLKIKEEMKQELENINK